MQIADIPCDLYFADLQWSWDGNQNNVFGEFPFSGDTVDLAYDVYIGRASIDNAGQVNTFILKDTTYEKRPAPNYMVRLFLPCGTLWSSWPGDSTQNMIARYPPVPPWVIRKMYRSQGTLNRTACTETLRTGVGFVHLSGHGDPNGVYETSTGPVYSHSSDVYNLNNGPKYIIANTIACDVGALDQGSVNSDCYGENFVNAPNGGAVAGIFNSRLGWGTIPGPGYSELQDMKFYENFFRSDTLNFEAGKVNALSKQAYRNQALTNGTWRWCYYQLNLFGDPALAMWSNTPFTLSATHPTTIPRGPQNFTVTAQSGSNPLQRALVCLWKGDEVYARGLTNVSGTVTLAINPTTTGQMYVTVTAKSHLPYEGTTTVGIEEEKSDNRSVRSIGIRANPVKDRLIINYALPTREKINAALFDVAGRHVATIAKGEFTGVGQIIWRTADLASGVYFVQIDTKEGSQTEGVLIVK